MQWRDQMNQIYHNNQKYITSQKKAKQTQFQIKNQTKLL